MAIRITRERHLKKSLSLPARHHRGLQVAAMHDGHGNISRIVQDLIEDDLRRRYGRDWAERIEADQALASKAAA